MAAAQQHHPVKQLFEGGFRIFFLSAAIYAAITMIVWISELSGLTEIADQIFAIPLSLWHAHELIFGFIVAVVTGFLTTAVPVWTGSPRVRGPELTFLFALWLSGRLAISLSALLPAYLIAVLDISFLPILAIVIARRIVAKKMWRNLGFIPLLLAVACGNLLFHLELLGITEDTASSGIKLAIGLFILITVIIGGRVIPVFTSNWRKRLGMSGLEPSNPWIGRITIISCLIAAVSSPLSLDENIVGTLNLIAGFMILLRLSKWRSWETYSDPLVWILHVGYALMGVGFLTEALHLLTDALPQILAQHVFTIGGLGVMVMGMMSRIALGHTGRALTINPAIILAYILILVSLTTRILPAMLFPDFYDIGLHIAGTSWILAWILYLFIYIPIFLAPRPDGKAG